MSDKIRCNGTRAYMEVYPEVSEESARRLASKLLTRIDIKEYLASLLAEDWFNRESFGKELKKLITQDKDNTAKLWWLRLGYNVLWDVKDWTSVTVITNSEIENMSVQELAEEQRKILNPEK